MILEKVVGLKYSYEEGRTVDPLMTAKYGETKESHDYSGLLTVFFEI